MVDLYSGLGGASEAFYRSADWEVLRIENNEELLGFVPNTWFHDVPELLNANKWRAVQGSPTLLWASPPCTDFSQGYNAPGPKAKREGVVFNPDMTLIQAAIDLRELWKPKFWCFENVIGAIPYFEPLLGEPTQIVGPFVLWHNLPHLVLPEGFQTESKIPISGGALRANLRGKIPLELSEAVMEAASLPTLEDYL
jgi:hypothetical protein